MAYHFNINKGSTLPYLRMDVISDGRHNYEKCHMALQSADVYFSMTDINTGVMKIANAKAYVVQKENSSCSEEYCIEYRWNKRDTNTEGTYVGQFRIIFSEDLVVEGYTFPKGELIVPISEELLINVNGGSIRK